MLKRTVFASNNPIFNNETNAQPVFSPKEIARLVGKKPKRQFKGSKARKDYLEKVFREYNGDKDSASIEYVDPSEEMHLEDVRDEDFENLIAPAPTLTDHDQLLKQAIANPLLVTKEMCRRDLREFIKYFWSEVAHDALSWNWHIDYICGVLMKVAEDVAQKRPRDKDVIFNVPPGSTKSLTCSVMFPVWCWTRWPWMRFICSSYSAQLSLEQADYSRDMIRSPKFRQLFPEIAIKEDKDTKSNYRIQYVGPDGIRHMGGNRYSTSVGGTLTGFHGHILIVDDPLDPKRAASELNLQTANHWMSQTLSTRKIDKVVTPTILIMQRLHQEDPTGHLLNKRRDSIMHVCLPGEIIHFSKFVRPVELIDKYVDGLLDPKRLSLESLKNLEVDLGQYGYAGQIGQNPVPPGGGMFKVDNFSYITEMPTLTNISLVVRYWDKAGSSGQGAYTCGVKIARLKTGKFVIMDVKRGQWASEERERIIRQTAEADEASGNRVIIYHEQEPGSGGKDSAQATILNLAGYVNYADRPTGDKVFRADPYSVQVNNGNVMLLRGDWNSAFIDEHRYFPFGRFKDQVDATAGAMARLVAKRLVRRIV